MNKVILELKNLLNKEKLGSDLYKRTLTKEYFQFFVLDFIYSSDKYSQLVFYGGSALAQCYKLARLSEDLDFVDIDSKIDLDELGNDLEIYFKKELGLVATKKVQKFRIYLKFPILKELGLVGVGKLKSDLLNLKVEVFKGFDFCEDFDLELKPVFRHNQSVLIKTFDLSTLMSTKIRAVLYRNWEKVNKQGKTVISVKGRDYFDLMWYLQQGISPNLKCIEGIDNLTTLKEKLLEKINKVDPASIKLDLESFISDSKFIEKLSYNIKEILKNEVSRMK